tara:strand:- start:6 stop:605 length:600 start_codon:yes stop_codon:yes gene_type:complete
MSKKIYFQLSIFLSILFIIISVYLIYFKDNSKTVEKNSGDILYDKITKSTDDLITEMKYFSEDDRGNKYEIEADTGVINPNQTNLIRMNKVKAIVYLYNGEKIFINSDKAEYNNENNDTTFNGSVEMNYNNHKINAENMELSFRNNFATLYDNVNYNNGISSLVADKILMNLMDRNTKILMNNENSNILVRSNLDNGNN